MEKFSVNASQQLVQNDSEFAEMILDKAISEFRLEGILEGIERSLQERNKKEFLRLTSELKTLQKKNLRY